MSEINVNRDLIEPVDGTYPPDMEEDSPLFVILANDSGVAVSEMVPLNSDGDIVFRGVDPQSTPTIAYIYDKDTNHRGTITDLYSDTPVFRHNDVLVLTPRKSSILGTLREQRGGLW